MAVRFDSTATSSSSPAARAGSAAPRPPNLGRRGARVVVNDLGGSPRGGGSDPTMAAAVVDEIVLRVAKPWPARSEIASDGRPGSRSSNTRWTPGGGSTG